MDATSMRGLVCALIVCLATLAAAQTAPLVIAWQAPLCSNTSSCSGNAYFTSFVSNVLPSVSGIGVTVHWSDIDECVNSGASYWCTESSDDNDCTTNHFMHYYWCRLDQELLNYINSGSFGDKKIVLIVWAVDDSSPNSNSYTPDYVFYQNWANQTEGCPPASNCPPQDVVVCGAWTAGIGGSSCPVSHTGSTWTGDTAIWNVNGNGSSTGTIGCTATGNAQCPGSSTCSGIVTNFAGFPIVYETPFMKAYQNFLQALAHHYNLSSGSARGQSIAPYIAYVRAGMAEGGENLPYCAISANITQQNWQASANVSAGYLVNSGGNQYVAIGAGTTNAGSMPTCPVAGCTTAPDGTVPGWYRADPYSTSFSTPIWPGPTGQFVGGDPGGYSDNGYLSIWPPGSHSAGATGYIASMTHFLNGLGASFPFTISAHFGPPASSNVAYADSEAILASSNGVGFGIQAVSVYDSVSYAGGSFPSSLEDWAYNFKTYPAPVHHLQTSTPGFKYLAEGYGIVNISDDGNMTTATINCSSDCSSFSGLPVYISGNTNSALNTIWSQVTCTSGSTSCKLFYPSPMNLSGSNGTLWAADYWPIILPFSVQRGASSIEVYECALDYAFGLSSTPTTNWAPNDTGSGGCASWGVSASPSDPPYQGALANTRVGQPSGTSIKNGSGVLTNGTQF
jgi:hypothetical protein